MSLASSLLLESIFIRCFNCKDPISDFAPFVVVGNRLELLDIGASYFVLNIIWELKGYVSSIEHIVFNDI